MVQITTREVGPYAKGSPLSNAEFDNNLINFKTSIDNLESGYFAEDLRTLHSGTIVKAIVYDTSKDSDGGAWRKRTTHTSWYKEALGFTGKWLGQKTNLAAAWATSGAAAGDGYQNVADGKFYTLTGTSTASEIFRGNVREFPAVVALVVGAAQLVIYDLTQPSSPMWKSFPAAWKSATMRDGLLVPVGASGAHEISFVSDTAQLRRRISGITKYGPAPVANLLSMPSNGVVSASEAIVNTDVNDVAITVLDTAPIDAATGLPVPTIAVATAGGVSVIKDDGTVVNGASTIAAYGIAIDKLNRLKWNYYNHCAVSSPIQTLQAGFGGPLVLVTSGSVYGATTFPLAFNVNTITGKNTLDAFGGSGGFCRHIGDVPARTMAVGITNTYNTGWLPGDIRGAWLADTTAETISGSGELVTNGTFTTDTSGWTASNAVLSVVSGAMRITAVASGDTAAYLPFTCVVGKSYVAALQIATDAQSGLMHLRIGTTAGGLESGVTTLASGAGVLTLSFVATAATHYITARTTGGTLINEYFDVDNISVKLAEPDRCVKNKGVIVNGSLTKAAVASGAGLVAYSGFSAANYLSQPYDPNLDFGTGDFCAMGWVNLAAGDLTSSHVFFGRGTSVPAGPYLAAWISGGAWYFTCSATTGATSTGVTATAGLHFVALVRSAGVIYYYVDGVMVFSVANTQNITSTDGPLRFGVNDQGTSPLTGSLALWRIGATAPSADQIAHIYRTELPLFQPNAKCTIDGTSTVVTALSYDETTDLLHVGTSWGRSTFKNLTRIESEATTTGSITSISASSGIILTGGTSGKVYMPALLLRDELKRKDAAKAALGRDLIPHWYTATASQTVFALPKGFSIKAVYVGGGLKRPDGHDYTTSSDGFVWSITLLDACTAGDNVCIMGVYNG